MEYPILISVYKLDDIVLSWAGVQDSISEVFHFVNKRDIVSINDQKKFIYSIQNEIENLKQINIIEAEELQNKLNSFLNDNEDFILGHGIVDMMSDYGHIKHTLVERNVKL